MHSEFSYTAEAPSVSGLLRRLFASELFHQTDGASMESLAHYQLPEVGRRNAVVFLTQWRDSSLNAISYEAAAAAIAVEQKIREPLSNLDLDTVKEVFTFWEAERCVVSSLKERLLSEIQTVDVDSIAEIASQRKAGHWLSGPGRDRQSAVRSPVPSMRSWRRLSCSPCEPSTSMRSPLINLPTYWQPTRKTCIASTNCIAASARTRSLREPRLGSPQDPRDRSRAGLRSRFLTTTGSRMEPTPRCGILERMVTRWPARSAKFLRRPSNAASGESGA